MTPRTGIWKRSARHDSAPSDATVQKLCQRSSRSVSARGPAGYRLARQDLKAESCRFPGILCFLGWGGGAVGRQASQRAQGENAVLHRGGGYLFHQRDGFAVFQPQRRPGVPFRSATFEKRYVFPPTKHSPARSVSTLCGPPPPALACTSLCPKLW